ncbi:virion structural protein [Croceibacter phage P2559S]|uniref:virion structural protein n=1 Tax=Croceibacter phage P2559S TaxID=1176422 RepID=UPI0002688EAF|nr:virion structural protein [Croceibacter phage P2559S]AFM54798.1 hypothetical protein P2559S_20 [Croceibacter phage P2559S]
MITNKIGKHTVQVYNAIDELPTERFFTYNRMMLLDSGIGGDLDAIDTHITKAMKYVQLGKKDEAQQVLMNMRTSFYFVMENLNPKHLSYAALVYSIDGKVQHDFSDERLKEMVQQFSSWGASKSFYDTAIEVVKKTGN